MKQLDNLSIAKLHHGYINGDYSVTEIIKAYLTRIKKYNPILNAYITVTEKEALNRAKQLDKLLKHKTQQELEKLIIQYPLFGVPTALKDLYLTKNIRTTAGSKVLDKYVPQYSATAWQRLEKAGAVLLGKLNEDPWGHGSSGENSAYGNTKNPWDTNRIPGGSSSGPGAAIAANLCLIAGGTDTGGSIRNPAGMCGTVGLKPTYGRVSRYGIIAYASSLDTIGHLTKNVEDSAKYLEITAGKDPLDATSVDSKVPLYSNKLSSNTQILKKITIGIPKEYYPHQMNQEIKNSIQKAIQTLQAQGSKTKHISLPLTDYGISAYYLIASSETSSNLGRYDGIRYGNKRTKFGNETKRRIMLGTFALSAGYYDAYYKKAMKIRTLIKQEFEKKFQQCDILITPVTPTPAFKFGEKQNPLQMYMADIFTIPASLAGIPVLTVPCGFTKSGLPIGMQIMGTHLSEKLLFQVGHAYQQLTDWHTRTPEL